MDALQMMAMTTSSLQRTKEGLVYQRIKALLVSHAFAPGEKILAHMLADRLGVSGTPVREALIRLQAENFLSSTPNRGFFFKPISFDEMADLYRFKFVLLRSAVDTAMCAGTGTGNNGAGDGSPAPHAGAASMAIPNTPATATPESYAAFIEELYLAIISMAASRAMSEVLRNILERTRFIRRIDLELAGHLDEIVRLTAELTASLREQDMAAVARNLERLRQRQFAVLPDVVKEGLIRSCTA